MTSKAPENNSGKDEGCPLARVVWLLPVATAALFWLVAVWSARSCSMSATTRQIVALVAGGLVGLIAENALKAHFCHKPPTKDRRD
jgi:hypothetical protein